MKRLPMNRAFALGLVALAAAAAAHARVYSLSAFQEIPPVEENGAFLRSAVGIDGDSIIIVNTRDATMRVRLFRRGAGGRWAETGTLADVAVPDGQKDSDVAMKNGIAAVRVSTQRILIFERVNNEWIQTDALDNPDYVGGLAVSGARLLVGAVGCTEGADAYVFEKNTAAGGRWQISGRISGATGVCNPNGVGLDLNNSNATIRSPSSPTVSFYSRNGSALDWKYAGFLTLPQTEAGGIPFGAVALQGTVAVAPGSSYFRNVNGQWTNQGKLPFIDYATGTGEGSAPVFRDGLLLTSDREDGFRPESRLYVFAPNALGGFDHVAILNTTYTPQDFDVSGRTVVVESLETWTTFNPSIQIFTLPDPIRSPEVIVNDFEARDVSGFTQVGSAGFGLAGAGSTYVYRSAAGGDAVAILNDSNASRYQRAAADLRPLEVASGDPWVGLALRYTDANNYYAATLRSSNVLRIVRKQDGVLTTLGEVFAPFRLNTTRHLSFTADGKKLQAVLSSPDATVPINVEDTSFGSGKVALMSSRTRVDFDNVLAAPSRGVGIVAKSYDDYDFYGRQFKFTGGHWEEQFDQFRLAQTDASSSTSAVIGVPTTDQTVTASVQLDSFGSSQPVASFGLLARYVDARTNYSLSVRSSGSLQIRKTVDGVLTVLRGVSFSVAPGSYHRYEFSVIGNELHASVDGTLVATALEDDIPSGSYGLTTYRSAIGVKSFYSSEP